jgi:broad specificity phosphatase PhoE
MADPSRNGYPGGESFRDVYERVSTALEDLLRAQAGRSILVVAHHVVNRTYLAGLLGLSLDQARFVKLDNCGISIVTRDGEETTVSTLNAALHLQGVMAA